MGEMRKEMTISDKKIQQMEKKVTTMTNTLEHVSYPTVLRDLIFQQSLKRIFFSFFSGPCFTVIWRLYHFRLTFLLHKIDHIPVIITMDYDTKRSPLVKWSFEGRFKLTLIDRTDIHKSLIYESAVVKLRPKHGSFAEVKDTFPDNVKLANIPMDSLLQDRFISENGIEFTLQIQETEDILTLESMEK